MTGTGMSLLQRFALTAFAGALAPLCFSPINMWLLGPISVALLYVALINVSPRIAAWLGWTYGFTCFGLGASWIYVSIHEYGNAGPVLSVIITTLFVAGLALFFMLQCWTYRRFATRYFPILGFTACWVLVEWLRSWLFTGFPWLYLGSAHVTSMFSGIAPILGVLGISFVIALSGAIMGSLLQHYFTVERSLYALCKTQLPTALLMLWGMASVTSKLSWVDATDQTLTVGIVQGNIEQGMKFRSDYLQYTLDTYEELSADLWQNSLVLWPETAIPMAYQRAGDVLEYFSAQAKAHDSTLVSGIFYDTGDEIYNSITALGNGSGIWHKQKLVPFGEYVPLRSILSNLLQLFALPMSSLSSGPAEQGLLNVGPYQAAAFICYEVVYPDFVRKYGGKADFLLTISNDTWFGASWGPWQHLQIAAMRARELGRYMLRATNDGVSAIIDERGQIVVQSKQFQADTLQGEVKIFTGTTPFARWGSWPILLLSLLLLLGNFYSTGKKDVPSTDLLK